MKKSKKVFKEGPIHPSFIADSIEKHQSKTTIGAHDIFLGQVRADRIEEKVVQAIEYTSYEEMAQDKFDEIREATFDKFDITCMHIYHSLGIVKAGEICLFVFVSSPHRKVAFQAIEFLVDKIKSEVPIFGKEIFEDQTHVWKVNQP
ncbi:molybdopterin converting factor [Flavobacteriaceae bacterium (ex Bugula neritina AB1)]|nr:molybdopterin converting factor [Flavobacteriaceae bacterium (ex Bugula neritina AB1)]